MSKKRTPREIAKLPDINFLVDNYHKHESKEIAEFLGWSTKKVYNEANKKGLNKKGTIHG